MPGRGSADGFILSGRIGRDMASVEEVKRRHELRLLGTTGVVGVGIGTKDGRECIRVYVAEDNPRVRAALPTTIEDVAVEVVVSGRFHAR